MMGLELMASNLGVSLSTLWTLIFGLSFLLFYAKDVKLGLMMHLLCFAGLFVWFYAADMNWGVPLTFFFITVILLVLSLFAVEKAKETPGGFI